MFTRAHRGGEGSPLVLVHGFTGTWRVWELVLPALERRHDVLAVTLAGHAGGPPVDRGAEGMGLVDAVERAMDDAGFATAHVCGNSLGGYVALALAARDRARSVVALAPAGGWAPGDESYKETLEYFRRVQPQVIAAAPTADALAATRQGRRMATADTTVNYEHIPPDLVAAQIQGSAGCTAAFDLIDNALAEGWPVDPSRVTCPVRFVWGTQDRLLPWPRAAEGYRRAFPQADWVVLDDVGHCPQLDVPLETAQLILGWTD